MTLHELQNLDDQAFLAVNTLFHAPALDRFFVVFTDLHKIPWVSGLFIALLLVFGYRRFGLQFWKIFVAIVIAATVSDLFCRRVLKEFVDRPRPGQSVTLKGLAVVLAPGTGNSFPSSHAANCFAVAAILVVAFPSKRYWKSYFFYVFALLVAFSRVFLGVHYPSDVIAGAAIGQIFGLFVVIFSGIKFMAPMQKA